MSSQAGKHSSGTYVVKAGLLCALTLSVSCDVYDRGLITARDADAADRGDDAPNTPDASNDSTDKDQLPAAASMMDAAGGALDASASHEAGPASTTSITDLDAGEPAQPAIPCGSGECWWSDPLASTCRSTGRPVPEQQPAPGAVPATELPEIYLGWTAVHLGGQDKLGVVSDQFWQSIGLDLDGLCTHSSTCDEDRGAMPCMPVGKTIPFDGELCRDNAFGSLQPLMAALPAKLGFDEAILNCNLWRGSYTAVMRIAGYDGTQDDPQVRVDIYMSTGLEQAATWTCPADEASDEPPRWSASATWRIDRSELKGAVGPGGEIPDSQVADAQAFVRAGYLVANIPQASLRLLNDDPRQRGFAMALRGTTWLGRLGRAQDGSWQLDDGLVAGRVQVDDLVQTVRELGTCEGAAYDSAVEAITNRADLLASGELDANASCDALSVGLGFEAAELTPGPAADTPPRLACCPSGQTNDDCNPVCGDGKVTGAESCDYSIAPWTRGACPASCSNIDACTPQVRLGTGCSVRCEPSPITNIGPDDGCCPPGGNAVTDPDCPSVCGNGVVEPDETCDPSASECPVCVSRDPCQIAVTLGSADSCDVRCEYQPVQECSLDGDGCCPSGCHSLNDGDCVPRCGNGVLEGKELCEAGSSTPCDTVCDDLDPCTRDVRTGSVGSCNLVCKHTPITIIGDNEGCCPEGGTANSDEDCAAICGNGVLEPGEYCDDGNHRDGDECPGDCKYPPSLRSAPEQRE